MLKGLGERGGVGWWRDMEGGGRRDRAGLRCSGGSYGVVCYLSTSDQSHLLQGEGEKAGGQGADARKYNGGKDGGKKKGADVRSKFVFRILVLISISYCAQACPFF